MCAVITNTVASTGSLVRAGCLESSAPFYVNRSFTHWQDCHRAGLVARLLLLHWEATWTRTEAEKRFTNALEQGYADMAANEVAKKSK